MKIKLCSTRNGSVQLRKPKVGLLHLTLVDLLDGTEKKKRNNYLSDLQNH